MPKKKTYTSKTKAKDKALNEPLATYGANRIHIFNSFEEQAEYELQEMAKLSPQKILEDLRVFINIAYGMHGYNPDKLPQKHTIQIIKKG